MIVATERATRPTDFKVEAPAIEAPFCTFCEGNESRTPPETFAVRPAGTAPDTSGWEVRVVPNKYPVLSEGRRAKKGLGIYDRMNGIGAHEVVVETPEHLSSFTPLPDAHVAKVVSAYQARLRELKRDERMVCGMVFKNVGRAAGASLEHTHSQIIVTPVVPRTVMQEMEGCRRFFDYRGRCLFCDMAEQEAEEERLVMDHGGFLAFCPYASRFPFETWILPKRHSSHFEAISTDDVDEFARVLKAVLARIEKAIQNGPYNFIIHTSPFNVGEIEHYHWHVEIIPRLTRVAGFEWGTGFYINPLAPERAAGLLREAGEPAC